jgi:hypothetical protein
VAEVTERLAEFPCGCVFLIVAPGETVDVTVCDFHQVQLSVVREEPSGSALMAWVRRKRKLLRRGRKLGGRLAQ